MLKNSDIKSMLVLSKLICKIKNHFIKFALDAEFYEYMGYQKYNKNYRDISKIIENQKLKNNLNR